MDTMCDDSISVVSISIFLDIFSFEELLNCSPLSIPSVYNVLPFHHGWMRVPVFLYPWDPNRCLTSHPDAGWVFPNSDISISPFVFSFFSLWSVCLFALLKIYRGLKLGFGGSLSKFSVREDRCLSPVFSLRVAHFSVFSFAFCKGGENFHFGASPIYFVSSWLWFWCSSYDLFSYSKTVKILWHVFFYEP